MSDSKGALKIYEDLPGWARGVVVVGGLVVTYMIGNTIYKKINAAKAAADQQNKLNQTKTDLNTKMQQGQQSGFSNTQYINWADEIATSFNGCHLDIVPLPTQLGDTLAWSNQGIAVREILKLLKNDVDYLQLQNAFGIRTLTKSWICGGDVPSLSLPSAIKYQLNKYEIAALNDILSKKGITYKF